MEEGTFTHICFNQLPSTFFRDTKCFMVEEAMKMLFSDYIIADQVQVEGVDTIGLESPVS
jgi:hypothetical protein